MKNNQNEKNMTMPGPKPLELNLSDAERQGLEKLVNRYSTGQQKALRGWIVLLAAEGLANQKIADELGISVDTVRLWRKRWIELQPIPLEDLTIEERFEDLPRPGAPPQITADQVCQIMEMACEKPEISGRPISQWTGREIADEIIKRNIVDKISPRHASRLLKKGDTNHT